VSNCKSFLVTETERKHVRWRARFQQHRDASCHQVPFFFFLQGKAPKEIHAILKETLREHASSYANVKNWVAQFKRGDFSTCVAPCPGRHKTVTTAEIINQNHELILVDRRISAKSIAEQLGISRERFGSIIHEDLDMRKLSTKCPEMPEPGSKTSTVPVVWANLKFFRRDRNDFLSRLVTKDETWLYRYDPETKQQSMEWRHRTQPAPKNSECKNPLGKFSPRFFWDQDGILPVDYFPKGQIIKAEYTCLCWCNWRTFWRRNDKGSSPRGSCSFTTMPWLTGVICNPEETVLPELPMSW